MIYRAIGLMSGSSLDGLDIAFVEFNEIAGQWTYEVKAAECVSYSEAWTQALKHATDLNARDYQYLHASYGRLLGQMVNAFIEKYGIEHQVQLIASHGHTTFHEPANGFTSQLGCGATIAAVTGINVVNELRQLDVALGGQGAPIVPVGEKCLFPETSYFLNIGGIANLSIQQAHTYIAFDVCPANRVLNALVEPIGKLMDEGGVMASNGQVHLPLLNRLNELPYYQVLPPKSLANQMGTDVVVPILKEYNLSVEDQLRTYVEHIAKQVFLSLQPFVSNEPAQLLVTGGGAHNTYLIQRMQDLLNELHVTVQVPNTELVNYKEAIVMALLGVLRWREENTTLSSVTGAQRSSIGGAVWIGQDA